MIIDHIDHLMHYEALLPGLKNAAAFLAGLTDFQTGRHEFDGGYLMIQKGLTKPLQEGTFEAHRNYIDVQILLEGSEEVAWADLRNLTSVIPYNAEKDVERFFGPHDHVIKVTEGMFYVAFPQDGHQAVSHIAAEQSYKKIVVKLPAY